MKHVIQHLTRIAAAGLVGAALLAPWPAHAALSVKSKVGAAVNQHVSFTETFAIARINDKADALGSGFTGKALTGIESVPGGYRIQYEGCDIYTATNDTKAFEVHGDIRAKYNAIGGPANIGLPVTDELGTPDGVGRYNHFAGGASIYWMPNTGPKLIRGAIRGAWANTGWETGYLGYPISDEIPLSDGRAYSDFQDGVLYWEGGTAFRPMTASLDAGQLAGAFQHVFAQRAAQKDGDLHVGSCRVSDVTDYGWDFWRSRNRLVTFHLDGWYDNGLLPDTDFNMDLRLLFYAVKHEDGSTQFLAALDYWHIHTSGLGNGKLLAGLRDAVLDAFQQPMDLGSAPKEVEVVSLKITPEADFMIYVAPSSRHDIFWSYKVSQVQQHLDDFAAGQ